MQYIQIYEGSALIFFSCTYRSIGNFDTFAILVESGAHVGCHHITFCISN